MYTIVVGEARDGQLVVDNTTNLACAYE
jgi:hypothetical protein